MKKINKKDLITLEEYSPDKLNEVLTLAIKIKKNPKLFSKKLWGKTLGMIFHKTSTRTRISFEVGMYELGGFALHLNAGDMQMGKISSGDDSAPKKRPESFEDTAKTLSCYLDAIMMRTYSHSIVEEIAKTATIPVINGLTDTHHPCQIVADLMTMKEVYGKLKGLNLVYIGDGNNIVHSLLLGSALCGLNFKVICPINY